MDFWKYCNGQERRKMKAGEESFPPSWVGQEFLGGNPPCSEGGKKFPKSPIDRNTCVKGYKTWFFKLMVDCTDVRVRKKNTLTLCVIIRRLLEQNGARTSLCGIAK
jgi:hypothetical protein